jgi:hypothetical protein
MDTRSVRVPDQVLVRAVNEELVLLNLDNEQYFGLDAVGTAMWKAVTTTSVTDAVQHLLETFEVDEATVTADLEKLLEELSARGLVEIDPS